MTGKLVKMLSGNTNLRTNEVLGEFSTLPNIGQRFQMRGEPLDPTKDLRVVETSPIVLVNHVSDNEIVFNTQNSMYKLTID